MPPASVMKFFEFNGCELKTERGNRVFPVSDRSFDVSGALERRMRQLGVRWIRDRAVRLSLEEGAVTGVTGEEGEYAAVKAMAEARREARLALMTHHKRIKDHYQQPWNLRNHSIFLQFFTDLADYIEKTPESEKDTDGYEYKEILPGAKLTKEAQVENTGYYDQYIRAIVTISDADDADGSWKNITALSIKFTDFLFPASCSGHTEPGRHRP